MGQCHVILEMNILVFFKNGFAVVVHSIIKLSAVLTVVTSMWSGFTSLLFRLRTSEYRKLVKQQNRKHPVHVPNIVCLWVSDSLFSLFSSSHVRNITFLEVVFNLV